MTWKKVVRDPVRELESLRYTVSSVPGAVNVSVLVHASKAQHVMYNRVPKCGSSTTSNFFIKMGIINNFTSITTYNYTAAYADRFRKYVVRIFT